jgi:chromosome segregation ATPase
MLAGHAAFALLVALLQRAQPCNAMISRAVRLTFGTPSLQSVAASGSPLKAAEAALARAERELRRLSSDEAAAEHRMRGASSKAALVRSSLPETQRQAAAAAKALEDAASVLEQATTAVADVPEELVFQRWLRCEEVAAARTEHMAAAAEAAALAAQLQDAEAQAAAIASEVAAAEAAAAACRADVQSALAAAEMWRHQVRVWAEGNLAGHIEALQRELASSQQNAAAMAQEILELRRLQQAQEKRNDWRRRENWPRLIGQRLGGLLFGKAAVALLALYILPRLRSVQNLAHAALVFLAAKAHAAQGHPVLTVPLSLVLGK